MASGWIGGLVGLGLLVLMIIAYSVHRIEASRLEKRRRLLMHKDRFRDLSYVMEVLPPMTIDGELPSLLTRSMKMHMEKAVQLDANNVDLQAQLSKIAELHKSVLNGGALPQTEASGSIGDELKEVQRGIKLLKEFILQQHRVGLLSKAAATVYIKSLQDIGTQATIDGLLRQALQTQGEGNKSLALRYYQLAFKEVAKGARKGDPKFVRQSNGIAEQIKSLVEDQKAINEATQEINQKLAKSISSKKDDGASFEMKQIN